MSTTQPVIEISDFVDVRARAAELSLSPPQGLAILPSNFDTAANVGELYVEGTASTVRKLWREKGLVETRIEKTGMKFPSSSQKFADWIGPIVFVSAALMSTNPLAVQMALGVVTNYLTETVAPSLRRPIMPLTTCSFPESPERISTQSP